MNDLIGFISIALISLITIVIGLRWPAVSRIIYVALSVRVLFIFIGHYFFTLPDSDQDALGLDDIAWSMAQNGFLNVIYNFPGLDSFFLYLVNSYSIFFIWKEYFDVTIIKFIFWARYSFTWVVICKKIME